MKLVRSLLQLLVLPCALVGLGVALGAMTRDIQQQAALLGCDPPAGLWLVWPTYAATLVAYAMIARERGR